jgi:hypothetical protein
MRQIRGSGLFVLLAIAFAGMSAPQPSLRRWSRWTAEWFVVNTFEAVHVRG